ncbi:DUF1566 domain-containing protein [Pseudomonas sp. LFM046]|uniref:Lcl domain-containing protein n=1 Tax=Pseudomonas sp. LFM046 TaxID=1608357 RepID=UPI0005CFB845|nr:DUF1566 domain-containing protein [Pseudomonas sp. LFM046]
MNALTHNALPTTAGTPFEGGFYVGRLQLDGAEYALIVSPKAQGELDEASLGKYGENLTDARSCNDGLANTQAMAGAGSDLARWMLALDINGFTDWYLPSRDELELCYRHLKPTTQDNWASFRDGDNPSSLPVGYPYTAESPAQTSAEAFRADGEQAFEPTWHWASTQYSPSHAWIQDFDDGTQTSDHKGDGYRARAVRRFKVTP